MHVQHAAASILELKSTELGELSAPDELDPLAVDEPRDAPADPVEARVPREVLQRRPGFRIREPETGVERPYLGEPGDERPDERIVAVDMLVETKLH